MGDEEHNTWLIRATKKSDLNAIEWLLKLPDIDVNKTGKGGATALHWAVTNAYNSDKDILQLFLASDKVLLDIGDENGDTPLMLAELLNTDPELFPLVHSAVAKRKSNANRPFAPLEVQVKDTLFSKVPPFTETTPSQPLASSLTQEEAVTGAGSGVSADEVKGYPPDTVTGASSGVLADDAVIKEAVTAETPSLRSILDEQWGEPGSSQTKISQGLPNRKTRYSPYAKEQKQRRNHSYGVVEPGQQGSWCLDQTKYSCLTGKDNWTSRLPILKENGEDDLKAITKEMGINSELAKEVDCSDKNSSAHEISERPHCIALKNKLIRL